MNEVGGRLARGVVGELLQQRAADALRRAARDLALDQHRVDGPADLVGDVVAQQPHAAGLGVDLDLAECRRRRGSSWPGRRRSCARARPGLLAALARWRRRRGRGGELAERERRARASRATWTRPPRARRRPTTPRAGRRRCAGPSRAVSSAAASTALPPITVAAARPRADAVGDEVGVAVDDLDRVELDAQHLGGDLRQHGLDALARATRRR